MEITSEKYRDKTDNIYSLVVLAAKRTASLTRGTKSLIPELKHLKPAIIALEEIARGKIVPAPPEEEHGPKK